MSLRARLLLGMAAIAVVLVVTVFSITRATQANLVRQLDQQLERTAPQVRDDRRPGPEDDESPSRPLTSVYVAVLDTDTAVLTTLYLPNTTEATASEPDITVADVIAHAGTGPFTVDAEGSDLRYRMLVRTDDREGHVVLVGLPMEDVDETLQRLLVIQGLAAIAILAALGLVTFWVLHLGVRPVQEMTAAAKAIGQGDLSQRIPESAAGTEAGELGEALNHMLGRIEESFDERTRSEDRLRQFVADASHELRTPVTTIRGYAELYRMGGLASEHDLSEAMRRTEQEATRMGQLVSDLLDLARLDQGRPLSLGPVDLAALAADAVADARAVEPTRPIELDVEGPAQVVGDDAHLRQIIANLVANARVHTDAEVRVTVRVRNDEAADAVTVAVADEGPGMTAEVASHAFERFYRADPARARHRGGSGLGLAIVAGTVAAHGGTVALDTAPGEGTTVTVTLPKSPTHLPPPT